MERKTKYGSRKTVALGVAFDSAAEARRYQELKLLERAEQITGLKMQMKYPLDVNGIHICNFFVDFEYYDRRTDRTVIEDVKSKPTMTPVYRLKKKLLKAIYGIDIREVLA